MPLNVLYESPVGFALFSVLDEGKFKEVSDVQAIFSDPSSLSGVLQLKKFKKFTDQVEATGAAVALTEGTNLIHTRLKMAAAVLRKIPRFLRPVPLRLFSKIWLYSPQIRAWDNQG